MACPYFDPGERLHGSSGSLGDLYAGSAGRATGGRTSRPSRIGVISATLADSARASRLTAVPTRSGLACPRMRNIAHPDSVLSRARLIARSLTARSTLHRGGRAPQPRLNRSKGWPAHTCVAACGAHAMSGMTPKAVRESISEYLELVRPMTPTGWECAGRQGHAPGRSGRGPGCPRHARRPVVTASVDYMNFLHPVKIGN